MVRDITTPITRNEPLGHADYLLEFEVPDDIATGMGPAQFFMIGIPGSDNLLRRPFSVCGLPGTFDDQPAGTARVLYRVYGGGTRALSGLRAGAEITVLGPLGRGFELPASPAARPVLVAGGIGSAPFPALIATLARAGRPRPVMFYGARTDRELPLLDWFRGRCDVRVATEDGSAGDRGFVTAPLSAWLDGDRDPEIEMFVCGPDPMMRAVAAVAGSCRAACQLSLEAHMACGFGVCIGCVVPVRSAGGDMAYERVCVEGPVMRAEHMAW